MQQRLPRYVMQKYGHTTIGYWNFKRSCRIKKDKSWKPALPSCFTINPDKNYTANSQLLVLVLFVIVYHNACGPNPRVLFFCLRFVWLFLFLSPWHVSRSLNFGWTRCRGTGNGSLLSVGYLNKWGILPEMSVYLFTHVFNIVMLDYAQEINGLSSNCCICKFLRYIHRHVKKMMKQGQNIFFDSKKKKYDNLWFEYQNICWCIK